MRRILLALGFLVLMALIWPGKALAVDCRSQQIPRLSIFISPLTVTRSTTMTLQIVSAPEAFRGQTFRFQFVPKTGSGPFQSSYYMFDVRIDESGNFIRSFTLANTAPSAPEGDYTISLVQDFQPAPDQPYGVQVCNQPFDASFAINIEGGVTCLELGASCNPSDTTQTFCNSNAFCDSTQSPARVRLPDLTLVILNNAQCAYLGTNGGGCAARDPNMPVDCGREIMTPLGGTGTPVVPATMCCASELECRRAQGEELEEELIPISAFNFCEQVPSGAQRTACETCLGQSEHVSDHIYTAVGCLRTSQTGLAGDLIRLGLGIGGGLALLSILAASFIYATSQGDQGKLKTAKELATGAVAGLLFMIFSVIILNFVGVQIFRIPGLTGGGGQSTSSAPQPDSQPPDEGGEDGEPEAIEPPEDTWTAEDVQWSVSLDANNPDMMQVCIQYPQEGSGDHSVTTRMRPVLGDNVYEFFSQPLSPPEASTVVPNTLVQCGSIDMADYSEGLIRNLIAQQTSPAISQQLNYDAVVSGGSFSVRSSVQIGVQEGQTLDEATVAQIFGEIPSEFAGRVYLEVQTVVDGVVVHQYQVQITLPVG